MEDFLTIKNFSHESPFLELVQLLRDHEIPHRTEQYRERLDPISMTTLPPEYIVKVPPDRFSEVDRLLLERAANEVLLVGADHYLFDFKDEELFDILASPDEWSAFDYQLARRVLRERGIEVDTKLLDSLNQSRLQQLAEPAKTANIPLGYAFALLGGLLGMVLGWHLTTARKTLPNGVRLHVYSPSDRTHGMAILALGLVSLILWVLWLRSLPMPGTLLH